MWTLHRGVGCVQYFVVYVMLLSSMLRSTLKHAASFASVFHRSLDWQFWILHLNYFCIKVCVTIMSRVVSHLKMIHKHFSLCSYFTCEKRIQHRFTHLPGCDVTKGRKRISKTAGRRVTNGFGSHGKYAVYKGHFYR